MESEGNKKPGGWKGVVMDVINNLHDRLQYTTKDRKDKIEDAMGEKEPGAKIVEGWGKTIDEDKKVQQFKDGFNGKR